MNTSLFVLTEASKRQKKSRRKIYDRKLKFWIQFHSDIEPMLSERNHIPTENKAKMNSIYLHLGDLNKLCRCCNCLNVCLFKFKYTIYSMIHFKTDDFETI